MKKVSLIVLMLFLVINLSGCGDKANNSSEQSNSDAKNSTELGQEKSGEITENEGNLVNKLKGAISSGKKMKCTYRMGDENGNTEVVTYLQGDKYKTEIVMDQIKTLSIFDGDAMYSWVSGQKVGTKMTMDCIDSLDTNSEAENKDIPENIPEEDNDKFVETLADAQNLNCEDAQDVNFDVPSDINFSDQCEMLKSQQKMIEDLNK